MDHKKASWKEYFVVIALKNSYKKYKNIMESLRDFYSIMQCDYLSITQYLAFSYKFLQKLLVYAVIFQYKASW